MLDSTSFTLTLHSRASRHIALRAAELIHFVGSEIDDEADRLVAGVIASLAGTNTIEGIVHATGLEDRVVRSVIRMVGRRICFQVDEGRLRYPTLVRGNAA